jgi:hypothetical protein
MRIPLLASALALILASPSFAKREPPDILLIIADDCTFNDLEIHGGDHLL